LDLTPPGKTSSLKLLFWLKWKLTTRAYQRSSTALAGVVLGLLVFVPLMALAALGSYLGYISSPPAIAENLLRGVLLGAYLFWILSPMMGFALNESFDVTKLFVYPVSIRQILFGAIAGSILDFPVLFLLPTLVSAWIGFAPGGVGSLLAALALLLFLVHTLALGQSIVLATAGMLRSRRYRDLLMVLFPLIWIIYYLAQEMMRRGSLRIDWSVILQNKSWQWVSVLPPGMAAQAVLAANHGEYVPALAWSGLLAAVTVGTVLLAAAFIQKVYAGDTDVIRVSARPTRSTSTEPASPSLDERLPFGLRLPAAAEAVYRKEVRYMQRDPSFKAAFLNLVYTLMIAVFMVMPKSEHQFPVNWLLWPATFVVFMSESRFFFNLFGTEGSAAALFFLYPASRRQMFVGKNLVYFLVSAPINAVLAAILCAISRFPSELPYLIFWMLLATGFHIAAGNLISVLFPLRVVTKGWKVRQQSAGQGCWFGILYLGVSLGTLLALMPVVVAIIAPRLWLGMSWLVLTLPLAVGYVVGAYLISLKFAERLLLQREVEVMQKLGAEE
jgi:ABC-2 type transport system permease protein